MNIFRRPDYRSDTTRFLEQLKVNRPRLEEEQRKGRSLLWDKQIDRRAQADFGKASVPQKPYVYQPDRD